MADTIATLESFDKEIRRADGFVMVGIYPCGDTFIVSTDSPRPELVEMVNTLVKWAEDEGLFHDA